MTYNLGIAVDGSSVGFAGVDLYNKEIKFCGAQIFTAAENPKNGESLAATRRKQRMTRRIIRRRSQRNRNIRRLLVQQGLENINAIDAEKGNSVTPWDLRKQALERKLTDGEFSRVLFHIATRRGFQSGRKGAELNDLEGKRALSGARELQEAMVIASAPTVGAYLATLPKKRNDNGSYERFVTRDLLRQEVKKIFEAQRKLGNAKATPKFLWAYAGSGDPKKRNTVEGDGVAFYQRPLRSSEHLVGVCILTGQKRAPKFSYTAELFILWSKINHVKIREKGGLERFLTPSEKSRLAALAHKNSGGVSYKQARKELELDDEKRFNISYRKTGKDDDSWEKIREATEKKAGNFLRMPGYHALRGALDLQTWEKLEQEPGNKTLDEIARILSFEEDGARITEKLDALGFNEGQIAKLSEITHFSKSVNLSLVTIRDILPHLEKGLVYSSACAAAGYHHSRVRENKGLSRVPPLNFSQQDIRNPVVARAFAWARKVINACIEEYGMPGTIIIEMGRHLGKPFKERKEIEREQKKNENMRDEARNHVAEIFGVIPESLSRGDILKYRLWKEQDGFCPYSGVYLTPETLRSPTGAHINYIIPYSRSWDNSYMNKVLCAADENIKKGERTPYEYLGSADRWIALEAFARNLPTRKAENMLMENFSEEKAARWQSRALNDSRYAARALKNHLEETLTLAEDDEIKMRNSSLIFHLRGMWGFPDKDYAAQLADRRPALEAIIIACSTQAMTQKLTRWNKYEKRRENSVSRPEPPKPWPSFHEDVENVLKDVFVCRKPVRTLTGAANQETFRAMRKSDGKIVQRVKLRDLSLEALENLSDKTRNIKLYTILRERLEEYGGLADKAFAKPIYMSTKDPARQGPRINSVRIVTNKKGGLMTSGGLASNGDMVRTDVFQKDEKFFLVPIYVHHFATGALPERAITIQKSEEEWEKMDNADFLFSLYKNDLVRVENKSESYFAYYMGSDRATGALSLRAHDDNPEFGKNGVKRTGVKNLLSFEKYSVDFFGNKKRIARELRDSRVGE